MYPLETSQTCSVQPPPQVFGEELASARRFYRWAGGLKQGKICEPAKTREGSFYIRRGHGIGYWAATCEQMYTLHRTEGVSHLWLCAVTKEEEKTRELNVYLLINSIACNELTTAYHVWQSRVIENMHAHISYWLICQETRNKEGVNAPRRSVLGLFGFRKVTYTPRRREYLAHANIKCLEPT